MSFYWPPPLPYTGPKLKEFSALGWYYSFAFNPFPSDIIYFFITFTHFKNIQTFTITNISKYCLSLVRLMITSPPPNQLFNASHNIWVSPNSVLLHKQTMIRLCYPNRYLEQVRTQTHADRVDAAHVDEGAIQVSLQHVRYLLVCKQTNNYTFCWKIKKINYNYYKIGKD